MKAEKRSILGLPPLPEDSIKVIRNMRAASPPASASDLIEQQQKRGRREHKVRVTGVPHHPRGSEVHNAWQPGPWVGGLLEVLSEQLVQMNASQPATLHLQPRAQSIVGTLHVALLRHCDKKGFVL